MLVLGVSLSHDASAVLLSDGEVVAAVEEERLNRMKHWDAVPLNAIRFCLAHAGVGLAELDVVAIAGAESFLDRRVHQRLAATRAARHARFGDLFASLLDRELSGDVRGKLRFFDHHLCHAFGAYATAGAEDALLVSLDGAGDGRSGAAYTIVGDDIEQLLSVPLESSLGFLYADVTRHLGFKDFDEYKVMGLAPYGDPARYRACFDAGIVLRDDGTFGIDRERVLEALAREIPPRHRSAQDEPSSRDLAASLQDAFERTALHLFASLRRRSGQPVLCYSGGCAHNCAFNGKLLASGLFDQIYVQPAADDSGLSIGAATLATLGAEAGWAPERRADVYLGPPAAGGAEARRAIEAWPCLSVESTPDPERVTARLLADGLAIGWVQGRSELGPRALGNRSILADPRPAENKARINELIKKREGFRPFAPAVTVEDADTYFELPESQRSFPTMSFILPVRAAQRERLGAVTHVDGSARVQTVDREDNPRFWRLLRAFGEVTGLPLLLNTSFNNHREPIVDTVEDAVACFLTTGLDALVVEDLIVRRTRRDLAWLAEMYVARGRMSALRRDDRGFFVVPRHASLAPREISRGLHALLLDADGTTRVDELGRRAGLDPSALVGELHDLWTERHVEIAPAAIRSTRYWRTTADEEWF